MTSADIFSAYNDHITDLLDSLVTLFLLVHCVYVDVTLLVLIMFHTLYSQLTQLLLKSSQDKRFVCEAADKALISITKYVSPTLLLPKLQPCLKNRNPRIRAKASLCFSRSVPRLVIQAQLCFLKIYLLQTHHLLCINSNNSVRYDIHIPGR